MSVKWVDEKGAEPLSPGALVLSCFPSAGLAATVAAHYIVRALDLPRIGAFDDPTAPPVALVTDGKVQPPIRVYGKGPLGVIVSELPSMVGSLTELAEAILIGSNERKARLVLGLEGVVPHPIAASEESDKSPSASDEHVWFASSDDDAGRQKSFRAAGARVLQDGVLAGVSGALLVRGVLNHIPVAVLLVMARQNEGFPDHRAAASLIETLDRIYPDLKIDTGPLRTQAEVIEKAVRAAVKRHESAMGKRAEEAEPPIYR